MTKTAKIEISSPVIFKVSAKDSGKVLGYLVASDSVPGTFYQVIWDEAAQQWRCKCPATKPCKHERAVREVQVAQYHARVARKQYEDCKAREEQDRRQFAALNGNRGFSMMR